ncbi:hypothetical protein [Terriglobus aquaticus]|uniref:Uncharacterized protein n=1 Tax=Terriglobus aquaticus TaxID=940139 RepID=A0ABW9KK70_9BACT|nr:hypothetical protein [Terriglobus aquaticus]
MSDEDAPQLELTDLFLTEVFFVEHFADLQKQMRRLFPLDPYKLASSHDPLEESDSMNAGRWSFVGSLLGENKFFPLQSAIVSDMPNEVERVDIELYKLIPSAWVLVFRARLKPAASEALNNILRRPPLGWVTLATWFPFGRFAWAHGGTSSENAAKDLVRQELSSIKRKVSIFVGHHFTGFFWKSGRDTLPVIEQLWVKQEAREFGATDSAKQVRLWPRIVFPDSGHWDRYVYKNWEVIPRTHTSDARLTKYSIEANEDDLYSIDQHCGASLSASYAILEVVLSLRRRLESIRSPIYSLYRKRQNAKHLAKTLALHRDALTSAYDLQRLALEKKQIRSRTWLFDINLFCSSEPNHRSEALGKRLELIADSLLLESRDYADLLLKRNETEAANRNLQIMLSLQRRTYAVTVLALTISLCALIGSKGIRKAVNLAKDRLSSAHTLKSAPLAQDLVRRFR